MCLVVIFAIRLYKLMKLRTVPTNKEVFFVRFMTMREKQISARATGIQKENWGVTSHFLEIIKQQLF